MNASTEKVPARVTKAEYKKLAAFRYNLRHFLRHSERAAKAAGLTSRQYQALLAIKGFPGGDCVTVGKLAEQLLIAHHSAVGLVDRLALQALVSREVHTVDRRQVKVKLTASGSEILEKLAAAHKEELRRLCATSFPPHQSPSHRQYRTSRVTLSFLQIADLVGLEAHC